MSTAALRTGFGFLFGLLAVSLVPALAYAATPSVVSAKIINATGVTITYSEPVNSTISDYSGFGGALSGFTPSSFGGSGSATITLVFGNANFAAGATGSLTIASTTTSVSTGSPFPSGSVSVSDGQVPALASVTLSSNNVGNALAQTGAVLTISLTANEPIQAPTVTIDNHSLNTSGSGAGPYTASYTTISGDPSATVSLQATLTDSAGNTATYGAQVAAGTVAQATLPTTATTASSATTATTASTAAPQISQTTQLPVYGTSATPSFTLTTNVAGSLTYGGSCSSPTANVAAGANTVTLAALQSGFYNTCSVTLHNTSGNVSNTLVLNPFTVDLGGTSQSTAGATTSGTATTTTAGDGYKFDNPLDIGATGQDVTELQQRLTAEGVYSGPITGYFGSLTQAAVGAYQTKYNLSSSGDPAYGYVGPQTRAALNSGE